MNRGHATAIARNSAERFYEDSLLLIDDGKVEQAVTALERACQLDPSCDIYRETLVLIKMNWSSSFDMNGTKNKVNKNQRPLEQSADTEAFAEAVRQNQKPQAKKMPKKSCEEFYIHEEKKPFASHSRFSDLCDKGQDCVTTHSKSTMCTNTKSYAECCSNSKAEKRAWSSSTDFANKQREEHTPVFLRSSSLDNSASPIDSLSEFEIPSQYRTSSLDSLSDRNYSSQVDWQVPSACSGNSVNGSPLHNCASFTQPHFVSNPSEHKCNLESCYENMSCGTSKEEKLSSRSPGDDSSSSLLSDGFDEELDARFMEELYKHQENSEEGWTSYYELLNKIVEKSLKEKEIPSNCQHHFSYVHPNGKDFSGLDDFNDEIYTSYETVANKSNTSGRLPSDEKPAASYGVKSGVFAGGNMKGSSDSMRDTEKGKETLSSSTRAPAEELPSLSRSEKDFYRNLKYYFGGGKVKCRKSSPGMSDSSNESRNKVKSEQKNSCKQDSGYAESFSSDSGTSSFSKRFCTDNKHSMSSLPKRSENVRPKDGSKVSSDNCGVQTEWASNTERAKEKTCHVKSSEGTSFRAEQRETRSATDSYLPKSTDKCKTKQCSDREPTCSTFQTQESEFRGWKPKDTVHNGSSTSRRKHNAPGTRMKRRRSKEKIETMPPSSDADVECKSAEQVQTDTAFDLGWLGSSFTQLKETGNSVAVSCGQYCGVVAIWFLAIATLIISTAIAGAIHMCSVMYSRCQQYLRVSAVWICIKGKVSTWYQWLKSWVKLPKRSVNRNQSFNLPKSGSDAIQQMLSNKDSDPYSILGVAEDAADEDIKRQYRKLAILVHPDKNPHPDADEAFKILKNAFETLETPEKRVSYENEMRQQKAEASWAASGEGPNRYFNEYREKMRDMKNHIYCESCDGRHRRYPTNRPIFAARYCAQCHTRHMAKEGDVWLESSLMGFKVHFYACMDNEVFEVTDWAKCQNLNSLDRIPADAHSVSLKIRTHPTRPSHSGHRNFPFRSEEDLLEDLLRDMFRHDYSDFPFGDYPHHNRPKKRAGKRKKRR